MRASRSPDALAPKVGSASTAAAAAPMSSANADEDDRPATPAHWGIFNLAFHEWNEPVRRVLAAAGANRVDLVTPLIGEWVDAESPFVSTAWYATRAPTVATPQ